MKKSAQRNVAKRQVAPAEVPAAQWVRPQQLKPWPDNPRLNDPAAVARVAESIRRFGFAAPIVARLGTKEIIAGHTRWLAAQELKLERVPVRFISISETDAHLLAVADNRLTELGKWEAPRLNDVLSRYQLQDVALAGWTDKDRRELDRLARGDAAVPDDDVPEPPAKPITQPGDLWELGPHRLLCGDSTNALHVACARSGPDTPFMMVTDPPYGVEYDPHWRADSGLHKKHSKRMGLVENDSVATWAATWNLWPGAVAYVWCGALFSDVVAHDLDAAGLERRALIVWRKPQFVVGRGHYHWQHETAWYAVRAGKPAQWCGDRTQSTVWDIARKDETDVTQHSTQKPVECMARPIRNHGKAGDVIYEPFSGSGTTIIACEHLKRTCVALEITPAYCDVAVERWQTLTGGKAKRIEKVV